MGAYQHTVAGTGLMVDSGASCDAVATRQAEAAGLPRRTVQRMSVLEDAVQRMSVCSTGTNTAWSGSRRDAAFQRKGCSVRWHAGGHS